MKTIIQIHKDGQYYVAVDLITNVADQGLTEEAAVANLKKGLEEHYQILMELAPKDRKTSFLEIEVEQHAPRFPFSQLTTLLNSCINSVVTVGICDDVILV